MVVLQVVLMVEGVVLQVDVMVLQVDMLLATGFVILKGLVQGIEGEVGEQVGVVLAVRQVDVVLAVSMVAVVLVKVVLVKVVLAKVVGGLKLQVELIKIDVVLGEEKRLKLQVELVKIDMVLGEGKRLKLQVELVKIDVGEGKSLLDSVEGSRSTMHILEGGQFACVRGGLNAFAAGEGFGVGAGFAGFMQPRHDDDGGFGAFLQHGVSSNDGHDRRTRPFQFCGNVGMGLDGGGVGPGLVRGGFALYNDASFPETDVGESVDWGNITRIDAGMPASLYEQVASLHEQVAHGVVPPEQEHVVDREDRVDRVNVNLALSDRNLY
jgi:hypothetical protein